MPEPYESAGELRPNLRDILPGHAQEIYVAAYNNALEQYRDPADRRGDASLEETAHRVAWAAVKEEYEKGSNGEWHRKE